MDLRNETIAKLFFSQVKALTLGRDYVEWKDYRDKLDFLELLRFQQETRRQSINNLV